MFYIPIIKLKQDEIKLFDYISNVIVSPSFIPFFEIRFDIENSGKRNNFKPILNINYPNGFFIGIPHNKQIIKEGNANDNDFIKRVNKDPLVYLEETKALLSIENAVAVFYLYELEELELAQSFIETSHLNGKNIGIVLPSRLLGYVNLLKLNNTDYLFIDIGQTPLKALSPRINDITNLAAKIIVIRENIALSLYNSSITDKKEVPFLFNDLSNEIPNSNIDKHFFGFSDYCGAKNSINITNSGMDRSKQTAAVALYYKDKNPNYYLGVASKLSVAAGGLNDLGEIVLERIDELDPNSITPIKKIIEEKAHNNISTWNVIAEWFYICQMYHYDDWKLLY